MNKDCFRISSIYIGSVIGAGFASGKEIIEFFGVYGAKGILGILLTGCLFCFIGSFFLSKVYDYKIKGYNQLINYVFGQKLGLIIDILVTLFLFIGFCIMVSGSGAIFNQEFKLSYDLGILVMVICCFITFVFGLKGLSFINSLLVPVLIIIICFLGSMVIGKEGLNLSNTYGAKLTNKGNWVTSSILYVSYNSLLLIVVLSNILPIIPNKKIAIKGGFYGGLFLCLLALFILIPILILYNEVYMLEIPMLKVCEYLGHTSKKVFGFILWISMFTTAVANGFAFIKRIYKDKKNFFIPFLFCLFSIPLARIGFAKLVNHIYPISGYIGIIIIFFILFRLK